MSGDNGDDESVWDEIGEFTSEDPSDAESTDDESAKSVGEPDVIDVDPVETGEEADPGTPFEERTDEYASDTAGGPETADNFEDAGVDATVDTDRTGGTDQPAGPVADPETDEDGSAALDAGQPSEAADAPDAEEVFDQEDVSQVDGEALWDELAGFASGADEPLDTAAEPTETPAEPTVDREDHAEPAGGGSVGERESAGASADSDEAVVDKRQYCQQCPFFSDPPTVACSHEGTEIVEVLTDGQFRLRGCPVVTESGPDRTILNDGS